MSKKSVNKSKKNNTNIINRNNYIKEIALDFRNNLVANATSAEITFQQIAYNKGLHLEFQYIIYIKRKKNIVKFYIADFCDIANKIIFEIDGGYHTISTQFELDQKRTAQLQTKGYTIYRITNKEVYKGETEKLLNKVYSNI